jgi:hypothetical protein
MDRQWQCRLEEKKVGLMVGGRLGRSAQRWSRWSLQGTGRIMCILWVLLCSVKWFSRRQPRCSYLYRCAAACGCSARDKTNSKFGSRQRSAITFRRWQGDAPTHPGSWSRGRSRSRPGTCTAGR